MKNSNGGWVSLSNIYIRNVSFIASLIFFPLLCCLALQVRETLGVIVDITYYSSDETELKLGGERVNGKLQHSEHPALLFLYGFPLLIENCLKSVNGIFSECTNSWSPMMLRKQRAGYHPE